MTVAVDVDVDVDAADPAVLGVFCWFWVVRVTVDAGVAGNPDGSRGVELIASRCCRDGCAGALEGESRGWNRGSLCRSIYAAPDWWLQRQRGWAVGRIGVAGRSLCLFTVVHQEIPSRRDALQANRLGWGSGAIEFPAI